mgnify:CR=1 FL=1
MNKKLFLFMISLFLVIISVFFAVASLTGRSTSVPVIMVGPTNFTNITIEAVSLTANLLANNETTNVTWFAQSVGTNYTILTINTVNTTNGTTGTFSAWATVPHGYINLSVLVTNSSQYGGNQTEGNITIGCGSVGGVNAGAIGGCNLFLTKALTDTAGNVINISAPVRNSNNSGTVSFKGTIYGNRNVTTNATWFLMNSTGANTTLGTSNAVNNLNITNATTGIADGNYTVWLLVSNNSVGANNSGTNGPQVNRSVLNIIIDNTKPSLTVTFSDADDKILTRSAITVTCTSYDGANRDLISGVDTSLNQIKITKPNGDITTYSNAEQEIKDLNTAQSGTYTAECLATDYAGNQGTKTKEFQVNARTSSAGVTTTEGGVKVNYDLSVRDTTSASGREGSVKSFTLDGTVKHEIEFKTVTSTSVTIIIRSEPQELTLNIGESKEVDLNGDG